MSKIQRLIDYAHDANSIDFEYAARQAIPDLQRLVAWIGNANHLGSCDIVTHWTENSIDDPPCSCGLSEIQSLLGE